MYGMTMFLQRYTLSDLLDIYLYHKMHNPSPNKLNKMFNALLRQDREDQGALGGLVDHHLHLCLVNLVDPMIKIYNINVKN